MKRGADLLLLTIVSFLVLPTASAACTLGVELINQDPYPAVPGEYVRTVFQLSGLGDPSCGTVAFELLEEFPFSLEEGTSSLKSFRAGTYTTDFQSYAIIPYEIIVNPNALDGSNKIEVAYSGSTGTVTTTKEFNIEVENVLTDFEVSISDYLGSENKLSFEILNIGENDAEAVVVEIQNQENINVKGSNREIIGGLDSNDFSTFDFEAVPSDGEIKLKVLYTDEINERRSLEKTVTYDSSYFTERVRDRKQIPVWIYILSIIIVILIAWRINHKIKKRRKEKIQRMLHLKGKKGFS